MKRAELTALTRPFPRSLEAMPSLFQRDESRVREMQRKIELGRQNEGVGKVAGGGGGGGGGGDGVTIVTAGVGAAAAAAAASSQTSTAAGGTGGGGEGGGNDGERSHHGQRTIEWGYWNLSRGADTPAFGSRVVGGGRGGGEGGGGGAAAAAKASASAAAEYDYEELDSDDEEVRRSTIRGRGIVHVAIPQRRTANVNTFTLRLWSTPSHGGVNLNNRMRPLSHCLVALSPALPHYGAWLSDILSCGAAGLRAAHLRLGEVGWESESAVQCEKRKPNPLQVTRSLTSPVATPRTILREPSRSLAGVASAPLRRRKEGRLL